VTMPTERLSMRKIREILRMKLEAGMSERSIARSLLLSNGAVNSYLKRARVAGLVLAGRYPAIWTIRRWNNCCFRRRHRPWVRRGFVQLPA